MAKTDLKLGLKFVLKILQDLNKNLNFCEEDVGFSLDGASVTHKMNDSDQDRAPGAIAWRKSGPGFDFTLTAQ